MKRLLFLLGIFIAALCIPTQGHAQYRSWKLVNGLYGGCVRNVAIGKNGLAFATTDGGLYRSVDNCRSWSRIQPAYFDPTPTSDVMIHPSGKILVVSSNGLWSSIDKGATWQNSGDGKNAWPLFTDSTGRIYARSFNPGGLLTSTDIGKTWSVFALDTVIVRNVYCNGRGSWLVTSQQGLFRSPDNGKTWMFIGPDSLNLQNICGTKDGTLFARSMQDHIYRSDDEGRTWREVPAINDIKHVLYIDRNDRLIIGSYFGVYVSTDKGTTWKQISTHPHRLWSGWMMQDAAGSFYAGSLSSGLFRSVDGTEWEQLILGMTASSPRLLCESRSGALFACANSDIFVSRDDGITWAPVEVEGTRFASEGVVDSHGHIFLSNSSIVVRSEDDGRTWTRIKDIGYMEIHSLYCTSDDVLIAATYYGAVYRSADEGRHWTKVRSEENNYQPAPLILMPDETLVTNRNGKLLRSRDKGTTWEETGTIPGTFIYAAVAAQHGALIVSTPTGLARTDDYGASWKELSLNVECGNLFNLDADESGSIYFARGRTIYQSVDNGTSWSEISAGIVADFVTRIRSTSKGYLFAETQDYGLYRTINPVKPLSRPDKLPEWDPDHFTLAQNYPNPFNPTTTIEFTIPSGSFVSLTIFNGLGQEVAALAAEELPAGTYYRQWNASAHPSGVYFYRLQAGGFMSTKRLIYLR